MTKKRVLIFYNECGGAHTASKNALIEQLSEQYEVEAVNFGTAVYDKVEWLCRVTRGLIRTDDLFNFILRHELSRIINWFSRHYLENNTAQYQKEMAWRVRDILAEKQPDVVISVIPMMNGGIYDATKSEDIPFCIFSLDAESNFWNYGISGANREKFILGLCYWSKNGRNNYVNKGIPNSRILDCPYPIRSQFLQRNRTKSEARKALGVPEDKNVIMTMYGAAGAKRLKKAVNALISMDLHVIVAVGKNYKYLEYFEKLKRKKNASMSVVAFTPDIAKWMQCADLIVTKAGPTTIMEAISMEIPVAVEKIKNSMMIERENLMLVSEKKVGFIFRSGTELIAGTKEFFESRAQLEVYQENMRALKQSRSSNKPAEIIEKLIKG